MIRVAFGLVGAIVLGAMALPAAAADFDGQCETYVGKAYTMPDGAGFKEAIGAKFGGDIGAFCTCSANTIKSAAGGDLDNSAAALKEINDALSGGATQQDLDKLMASSPNSEGATAFVGSMIGCAAGK